MRRFTGAFDTYLVAVWIMEEDRKTNEALKKLTMQLKGTEFNDAQPRSWADKEWDGFAHAISIFEEERFAREFQSRAQSLLESHGYGPDASSNVEFHVMHWTVPNPKASKLKTPEFWKLVDRIGDNPANIQAVVPPDLLDGFYNKFFEVASKISDRIGNIMGEIRDQNDYSAWGVVAEGKRRYQAILRMFRQDPENAAYYVLEEFDGEEYGSMLIELLDG